MSNPWRKDQELYDVCRKNAEKMVDEMEKTFGKPQQVKIRSVRDYEIGKHCVRAIREFANGQIKADDMWSIINNRHTIVPSVEEEKGAAH